MTDEKLPNSRINLTSASRLQVMRQPFGGRSALPIRRVAHDQTLHSAMHHQTDNITPLCSSYPTGPLDVALVTPRRHPPLAPNRAIARNGATMGRNRPNCRSLRGCRKVLGASTCLLVRSRGAVVDYKPRTTCPSPPSTLRRQSSATSLPWGVETWFWLLTRS